MKKEIQFKEMKLEIEVYQIKWRWWWSSSEDNLSRYTSSSYHKPYQTLKVIQILKEKEV